MDTSTRKPFIMNGKTTKFCSLVQSRQSIYICVPAEFIRQARLKKGDYMEAIWGPEAPHIICFYAVKGDRREILERAMEAQDNATDDREEITRE